MSTFTGKWQTSFGTMDLQQQGSRVTGTYSYQGTECSLDGAVTDGRFVFTYQEPVVRGEGWFELRRNGRAFAGQWRPEGSEAWGAWEGERIGFDGLWNSTFGPLRLIEEGGRVHGYYEVGGGATVEGQRTDSRLEFTYQEPRAGGRGRFELAPDGLSFLGEWQADGDPLWRPWQGLRVRPQQNLTYLVVVEAPWQRYLAEREFAFGDMLREVFARLPGVEVRHRFFSNAAGLLKILRELTYIAEPVVLMLATHALPEGITVGSELVGVPVLLDSLRYAGDLRLVHFSACLLMQDPAVRDLLQAHSGQTSVAFSGYTTSVDWAASAIIEFAYLDLILGRGLAPAVAAEQLTQLLPFAGDHGVPGGAYPAAGFRLVTADGETT